MKSMSETRLPTPPWRKNNTTVSFSDTQEQKENLGPKEAWGCSTTKPSKRDEVDVASVIDKIQHHIFPRRTRMKEFFTDFDPLKCGRVTMPQAVRAVGLCGC